MNLNFCADSFKFFLQNTNWCASLRGITKSPVLMKSINFPSTGIAVGSY